MTNPKFGPEYFDEAYYFRGGLIENKMHEYKDRAEWLARQLPKGRVLEIGAGEGCLVTCLSRLGVDIIGIDISSYGSRFSKEGQRVQASDDALPFRDESFAAIVGFDIMEHNMERYIDSIVRELGRVCVPGGYGFLNIALEGETTDCPDVDETHFTLRPRKFWTEKISREFEVLETQESCPTLNSLDAQFVLRRRSR